MLKPVLGVLIFLKYFMVVLMRNILFYFKNYQLTPTIPKFPSYLLKYETWFGIWPRKLLEQASDAL